MAKRSEEVIHNITTTQRNNTLRKEKSNEKTR